MLEIHDNPAELRFEAHLDGELAGFIEYEPVEDRLVLIHTEVLPDFEGQGVGSRLVTWTLDDVRSRGLNIVPQCPFVAAYIRRHPEYRDLVVGIRGRRAQHPDREQA